MLKWKKWNIKNKIRKNKFKADFQLKINKIELGNLNLKLNEIENNYIREFNSLENIDDKIDFVINILNINSKVFFLWFENIYNFYKSNNTYNIYKTNELLNKILKFFVDKIRNNIVVNNIEEEILKIFCNLINLFDLHNFLILDELINLFYHDNNYLLDIKNWVLTLLYHLVYLKKKLVNEKFSLIIKLVFFKIFNKDWILKNKLSYKKVYKLVILFMKLSLDNSNILLNKLYGNVEVENIIKTIDNVFEDDHFIYFLNIINIYIECFNIEDINNLILNTPNFINSFFKQYENDLNNDNQLNILSYLYFYDHFVEIFIFDLIFYKDNIINFNNTLNILDFKIDKIFMKYDNIEIKKICIELIFCLIYMNENTIIVDLHFKDIYTNILPLIDENNKNRLNYNIVNLLINWLLLDSHESYFNILDNEKIKYFFNILLKINDGELFECILELWYLMIQKFNNKMIILLEKYNILIEIEKVYNNLYNKTKFISITKMFNQLEEEYVKNKIN